MELLLDTNIVSYWMRGDERIIAQVKAHRPCDIVISAITIAEILYGIEKSTSRKNKRMEKLNFIRSQLEIIPFDTAAFEGYGIIRSHLKKKEFLPA
jgi:tRNA(fMet)-specific endonuclease VapC